MDSLAEKIEKALEKSGEERNTGSGRETAYLERAAIPSVSVSGTGKAGSTG
jgi:hypothetical protein